MHRRYTLFINRATTYAKDRSIFGRPIGQNQVVQFPIAQAHTQTEAAVEIINKAPQRQWKRTPLRPLPT
ncbi:MAG: acyl-CoA dehydrogenase family protein [Pseudomonadota bacterium]